jgi:hypothetical protein
MIQQELFDRYVAIAREVHDTCGWFEALGLYYATMVTAKREYLLESGSSLKTAREMIAARDARIAELEEQLKARGQI